MRRCHFLGPRFFFFSPGAGSQILCCCLLCIQSPWPRTSRQCVGGFSRSSRRGLRRVTFPGIGGRTALTLPGGVGGVSGLGPRHAGGGPAFVSLFVSAAARLRAGGAPAATPEEAGPRRRAPPGVHFTAAAAAALVCSDTRPARTAVPRSPRRRTRLPATFDGLHPTQPCSGLPPQLADFSWLTASWSGAWQNSE